MLTEEIDALERLDNSKERLVACADLATRALDAGDPGVFARAKSCEAKVARFVGMHQHAVVACAELMEVLPRVLALPEIDDTVERRVVWGLKYGAGSAMDLPEIPLATVRELLAALGRVLVRFGKQPTSLWELEARLAFIEGDADVLRDRVTKISPQISLTSHRQDYSDCPGCVLLQVAKWLGRDAPAEQVEAVLSPVFTKKPFPRDVPKQALYTLLYGDDAMCDHAKTWAPGLLARVYTRAGRLAEAKKQAARAIAAAVEVEAELRVRAQVVALEVALAADDSKAVAAWVAEIDGGRAALEDPYEELEAVVALHHGYARLDRPGELERLRAVATVLARRLDARLRAPRHERETLAQLGATSSTLAG